MELIIQELDNSEEPKLCLNMIVKNESHIIKDTLNKLLQKVQFDYWVISDTGSTDNTKEVIIDFFKEKNIKGEIYDDEWLNFGHNRTKALEHAYGKSKYVLIFDADDEICGNFTLPELTKDGYFLQFGDVNGVSYVRLQIINNKKKWKYVGVLHEIISCCEPTNDTDTITGDYYTISGRTSYRNSDETKYLKDALILEKAYNEAFNNNDEIYNRYVFYCANSYFDYGKYEEAIKWYKITLDNNNWSQEKYVACLKLFNCYKALNQVENGFFYLVKAFSYDKERVECLCELISHYCSNGMNDVAYGYYNIVKSFYNEKYLKYNLQNKLFLDVSKANFILPYYMILVADKMQDFDTITQMYKILFTKKHIETNKFLIGNFLYNLQFFIETVKNDTEFINLFKEYVNFLISINYPVYEHEFMVRYESYGILIPKVESPTFSEEECLKSNKILFYTGYSPFEWNQTFSLTNALGGSETAAISLSKKIPKNYKIYIAGNVKEETVDNIEYVNLHNLKNLINTTAFHTIIVSRYLNFYEFYKNFSSHQTFIWGHDVILFPFDTKLSVENILTKWSSKINGCVCQTEWHKNLFLSLYPQLKDKMHIINNGINVELFISKSKKINNRFLYTSCSERGLDRLLELWPSITENIPDSELFISSYNLFPSNEQEIKLKTIIDSYPNIKHLGKLNKPELYDLMSTAEYWLYPTSFNETSCITSMEMLLSEVICIYYPLAGLVNTLGDYGIPVERDAEIDTIMNLTNKRKNEIRKRGKEYAISCSWENRAKEWMKIMDNDNNINIEKSKSTILDMWKNYNVEPYYNFPVSKYWFGYSELKNYLLNNIDLTKQYNILEIGSFEGCSSCFISDIVINNALSTLTCVDPFVSDGSIETDHSTLKYKFYSNIKKTQNYNKINVVEKFSDDFYSTYNGSNFNFIYIDGEHSEKQILKDLDECFSLLDINGMIWCDDYNNKWKDIFDNWILLKNDFINVIHSGYQIAFIKKKNEVKIKGEKNIANEWSELPFLQNLSKIEKRMFDLYETISMPEAHTNILKKISETFTPNVIYDIGASTLHWTKAAKNIWPNTEFFAFDAIEEAEKLYKSKNIKYNIGVISDQDNKIVKFYENKENPAGNSYYKEIGHPNSVNVYPENSYIERKAMTLETVVKHNSFLLPDLVKIDVQGAELDILNGGMNIINNAKYLIIELQNVEYNRGAPLENITIDFLNKNGWEIVEAKFSDNGPDADYLFINKNYNFFDNENNSETQPLSIEKECSLENQVIELNETTENIWVFYPGTYFFKSVIQYIENLSDNSKKTIISNDVNYINSIKTDKIIFLLNPFNIELFERDNIDKFYNKNFSFLQLEPLTLPCHLNNIISYFNTYPYLKEYPIYDYSKTNIIILNKHGITNCIHLPYNCIQSELDFLIQANTNKKEYDFGFVYDWVAHNNGLKSFPIKPPRRNKIMSFLLENGFTINLIRGYGEDRDIEFGKCKIILNPHGQINEKQNPLPDECSNIFEHIRCDRLLKAGYTILSETSYDLDQDFIDKYPNLKIIKYEDFFNLEVINKIIYELNIKNIYDKTELQEYRYDTHNKDKADSEYQFKMCTPIQNQPSKKIIDCFTFYNELELLKYRLTILNDYVDYFVLVEATHTFVGKEKPLYYQENKELFKEFNHKIVHIVVDDFSHKYPNINIENREQWNNEIFQRNCIKRGLDKLKLNDEDIFTVTDLDEIADPKILEKIKKNEINIDAVIIELDFYYYNLNCKMKHPWHLSKMISYKKYKELDFSCEQIRQMPLFEIIPNAGWHLSYFGDEKFIKNKIENFGHQEYNIEDFTNENNILNRIKNQKDLYNRSDSIVNVEIEDNDNLPPKYDIYLKNFYTNNIQNIKSNLIKYSNLRDDICRFENYDDYINWQTNIGLSFEKDNNKWINGQRKCVEENFNTMERNIKILDICCGDGQGLKKFKEMGFKNVYGVEVCKEKINFAKQYGFTIYECDICCGPFEIGDNYDCIYSSHTIEHVLNPEYTIRNIMSKLKDNGIFILVLPYPDYWAANSLDEHRFKIHCGVIPLGLHINDKGYTICNTIRKMGYKITNYKFESYRQPEIRLTITK